MNLSYNSFTQITKQQAIDIVMDSIVNNRSDSVNVYMDSLGQTTAWYNLSPYDSLQSPYSSYWLFFIDEEPLYNWGHQCKYVFINQNNGNYTSQIKSMPPFRYNFILEKVSVSLYFDAPPPDFSIPYDPSIIPEPNYNLYAVIFGGGNPGEVRHWNAMSHVYCGLIEHGFPENQIYVLSFDGTIGPESNPSLNLNNYGDNDIIPVECSVSELGNVFNILKGSMTDGDLLYVFGDSHGNKEDVEGESTFVMWNQEPLDDDDFASMLQNINCSQMIINLFACNSGGFTDELELMNNPAKKTILTCTNWYRQYIADGSFIQKSMMERYTYLLGTALRGYHPDYIRFAPWARLEPIGGNSTNFLDLFNTTEINYDLIENGGNNNGIQEINESILYTAEYDKQFQNFGSKNYDCGFQEDLLSLYGITGDVVNTQTLSGSYLIGSNLSIEPGVELTLTNGGSFHMFDSKISLQPGKNDCENGEYHIPGGKFTVDNATITNVCDIPWKGINVIGDINEHQFSFENPKHAMVQGKLLLDGATIENAEVAISLFDRDNEKATRGGIVIAKNSSLSNNQKAVEFREYHNIVKINGVDTEYDYQSSFTNCDFVIDENYIFGSTYDKQSQVKLAGVKGIKFNGVDFINELDAEPYGRAIHAHDAGFILDKGCTNNIQPCDYTNSYFNGFLNAVEVGTSGESLENTYIRNSDFINNGVGIILHDMDFSIITDNTFALGWSPACVNDMGKGIFLDNSHGFAIENNEFTVPNSAPPAFYVGIHTNNTNNAGDEIYNNTFAGMNIANYAEGKNWNVQKERGLAYYCNKNTGNDWDFYVDKFNSYEDGIQKLQGNAFMSAGNEFSTNAQWHFDNNGAYEISYYYDNASAPEIPDINKLYRVRPEPLTLSGNCPNHYGNGNDPRLSSTGYIQKESDYNSMLTSFNSATTSFNSASDSTLKAFYANQLSYYNLLKNRAAYDIIRSNMIDTVANDSLYLLWQDKLNTYTSSENIVDYYIQNKEYSTALNKLDSIKYNFTFNSYDSIEYNYYSEFKKMQVEWLKESRGIFDLTTTERSKLELFANNSRGTTGAQARGILSFVYDTAYNFVNCVSMPDTTFKTIKVKNEDHPENDVYWIKVSPNPATNSINFTYSICEKENAVLSLFNQTGVMIDKILLEKTSNIYHFDCSSLKPGVYYYSTIVENNTLKGKFVIVN